MCVCLCAYVYTLTNIKTIFYKYKHRIRKQFLNAKVNNSFFFKCFLLRPYLMNRMPFNTSSKVCNGCKLQKKFIIKQSSSSEHLYIYTRI